MQELLSELQENVSGLWAPRAVQRIRNPTPEDFFRTYIATNTPVIIEGALSSWADAAQWTTEALVHRAGELNVTVDVTPDGHGDCVKSNLFVKPEERRMLFKTFMLNLQDDRQVGQLMYRARIALQSYAVVT
jgi:Cupin-like domain